MRSLKQLGCPHDESDLKECLQAVASCVRPVFPKQKGLSELSVFKGLAPQLYVEQASYFNKYLVL